MSTYYKATILIGYPLNDLNIVYYLSKDDEFNNYLFNTENDNEATCVFGMKIYSTLNSFISIDNEIIFDDTTIQLYKQVIRNALMSATHKYNLDTDLAENFPKIYLVQEVD